MFLNVKLSNLYRNDMSSVDLYYILIWVQGSKQIVFVLAGTRTMLSQLHYIYQTNQSADVI